MLDLHKIITSTYSQVSDYPTPYDRQRSETLNQWAVIATQDIYFHIHIHYENLSARQKGQTNEKFGRKRKRFIS